MSVTSIDFARVSTRISRVARRGGLLAPVFSSPPGVDDVNRTLRRSGDHYVAAIRTEGRPIAGVVADVIEAVLVSNSLSAAESALWRDRLWRAALGDSAGDLQRLSAA